MDCKKLIGKTFGDVLEDIQEYDGRVKLGSYDGSAHYWIGRASYLTTDGALEIENELHKLMLKRKKRAESALGNLAANPPSLASYVKKLAMDRETEGCGSLKGYFETLRAWFKQVEAQKLVTAKRIDEYESRKPLLDKEIKDAYLCTASWQKNDLTLLLEGVEPGSAWDNLEYDGKEFDTSRYTEDEQQEDGDISE